MRGKFLMVALMAVLGNPLLAQVQQSSDVTNLVNDVFLNGKPGELPNGNYEGSPYPVEDFQTGEVHFKNGKNAVNRLRYDAARDEMQFKQGDEILVIIRLETVDRVEVGGRTYFPMPLLDQEGESKVGYLEKLVDGEAALYVQYPRVFKKAEEPASSYDQYKPNRFEAEKPKYFLKYPGRITIQLLDYKQGFYEQLATLSEEVEVLAKKNKIKPKEAGYEKLVNLINENL